MAVVAVISVAFQYYNTDDRGGDLLTAALFGIAIYLGVSFIISIINALGGIVYFKFLMGSDMQDTILQAFRVTKVPPPGDWRPKRVDYLLMLADDPDESVDDRVKAAALYASIMAEQGHLGFIGGLCYAQAVDSAVLRYAQEAPRNK